jgi:hypothetical protein
MMKAKHPQVPARTDPFAVATVAGRRAGPPGERGVVLVLVVVLALLLSTIAGSLLALAAASLHSVRTWQRQDRCLFLACSGMEAVKAGIHVQFVSWFESTPLARTSRKFEWFDTWSSAAVGSHGAYSMPTDLAFGDGSITGEVLAVDASARGRRDLTLKLTAELDGSRRSVMEVVRYQLSAAEVFDYAYFINNFGWFWGNTITAMGDVRANGNFECRYTPRVNGDVIAAVNADLGADGWVSGDWAYWELEDYQRAAPVRARPADPPAPGYEYDWAMGYDGDPRQYENLAPLSMPYLGEIGEYEDVARELGGQVKQRGTVLVDAVYDGPGPDGVAGTPDDGTVVLVGTSRNPVQIDGPVVVRGDVVIRGVVSGQGTIYSGRNIHIIDDLEYDSPPAWIKPDASPELTAKSNTKSDLLGLAAKGNIILGDCTSGAWRSDCERFLKPPFTQAYDTDPSDADIGYDSDGNPGNGSRFDGNYTGLDGGRKIAVSGAETDRRYYECSNEQALVAAGPSNGISRVDAVCYTNHVLGGKTGSLTVNGSIVSRDEAINFTGSVNLNWDIRLGSSSQDALGIDIYLPQSLHDPTTLYWREAQP